MNSLLKLQELDRKIHACRAREDEIPKQKDKFKDVRARLAAELAEREQVVKDLELEQRACESDIDQKKAQIDKYHHQLNTVKKNEEYQALLHEIELVKKGIAQNEERIIAIMVELDEAKARLDEDKKRIAEEQAEIDAQCAEIDQELAQAIKEREALEAERPGLVEQVPAELMNRYSRLRRKYPSGDVVVPLREEVCAGCNMHIRAQIVNEILEGHKVHACQHCGRLLYHPGNFEELPESEAEAASRIEAQG